MVYGCQNLIGKGSAGHAGPKNTCPSGIGFEVPTTETIAAGAFLAMSERRDV
jgi:hypothetical protein